MRPAFADIDNAADATCGIAVMAKASIPGRTKTRLVPPLTFEEAAQCNTAFLRDVADNILTASARASIAGYIAYSPAHSRPSARLVAGHKFVHGWDVGQHIQAGRGGHCEAAQLAVSDVLNRLSHCTEQTCTRPPSRSAMKSPRYGT